MHQVYIIITNLFLYDGLKYFTSGIDTKIQLLVSSYIFVVMKVVMYWLSGAGDTQHVNQTSKESGSIQSMDKILKSRSRMALSGYGLVSHSHTRTCQLLLGTATRGEIHGARLPSQ